MIYTRKKKSKIFDFFDEKSEILGGFYLQKKNVLPKNVKKLEKITGYPQKFYGDE